MKLDSELERAFDTLWLQIGGQPLEREIRFHPTREWRFDRGDSALRIGIELDGGTWAREGAKKCPVCGEIPKGGHSTGRGRTRDCEKFNAAQLLGWRVFRFTSDMLENDPYGNLKPILDLTKALRYSIIK